MISLEEERKWEQDMMVVEPKSADGVAIDAELGPLLKRYTEDVAEDLRRTMQASKGMHGAGATLAKQYVKRLGYNALAYLALSALLRAIHGGKALTQDGGAKPQTLAQLIAGSVEREWEVQECRSFKDGRQYIDQIQKRITNLRDRRRRSQILIKAARANGQSWSYEKADHFAKMWVGQVLLETCLAVTPLFSRFVVRRGVRVIHRIKASDFFEGSIDAIREKLLETGLKPIPMLRPAIPWAAADDGGYATLEYPLIRTRYTPVMSTYYDAPAKDWAGNRIEACNILGGVSFRINQQVLAVAQYLWATSSPHLPVQPEWGMEPYPVEGTDEERKEWRKRARDEHTKFQNMRSKRITTHEALDTAGKLKDKPAFYLPHSLDSRGRLYPIPYGLTPQGDDLQHGLLEFAQGKPIGEHGARWLLYLLASAYGLDKETSNKRISWAMDHQDMFLDIAQAPLSHLTEVFAAEEPFVFLALCFDFEGYYREGSGYVSHAIGTLDATCSGYQHTALIMRDETTARLVNLTSARQRFDLYGECASALNDRLPLMDIPHKGLVEAMGISRGLVKRPTMTQQYGVTTRSAAEYIVDYLKDSLPDVTITGERYKIAYGLAKELERILARTVPAAMEYRRYMERLGKAYAEAGGWLWWHTPDGYLAHKMAPKSKKMQVRTALAGSMKLTYVSRFMDYGPCPRDTASCMAPDIIHSLDSSHLASTIVSCHKLGISHLAATHDCLGTHLCDVGQMQKECHQSYYNMYHEGYFLDTLHEELSQAVPGVDLPCPPKQGAWDVSEVLKSRYAFS